MPQGFASVDELFSALHAARDADDEGGLSILDHGLQCAELHRAPRARRRRAPGRGPRARPRLARARAGRLDAASRRRARRRRQPTRATRARATRRVPRRWSRRREALPARDRRRVSRPALGAERDHARVPGWRDGTPTRPRRSRRIPEWEDLVALRRADDAAKVRGRSVPGLDDWAAAVETVAAGELADERPSGRGRQRHVEQRARSWVPSRRLRSACRAAPGPAVRPRGAHRRPRPPAPGCEARRACPGASPRR